MNRELLMQLCEEYDLDYESVLKLFGRYFSEIPELLEQAQEGRFGPEEMEPLAVFLSCMAFEYRFDQSYATGLRLALQIVSIVDTLLGGRE